MLEKGFTLSADIKKFRLINYRRVYAESIRRNRLYQLFIQEQNGSVERGMHTIVEAARTTIHARNLLIKL